MRLTKHLSSEVPASPSSGPFILVERLAEVREPADSLGHRFIAKAVAQERPDARGARGKVWGTGVEPVLCIHQHSGSLNPLLLGSSGGTTTQA